MTHASKRIPFEKAYFEKIDGQLVMKFTEEITITEDNKKELMEFYMSNPMSNLAKVAYERFKEATSKTKYYRTNRDIFLRYFDSLEQYEALILAGNFKKMEEMIKENSVFNFEDWAESFINKKEGKWLA